MHDTNPVGPIWFHGNCNKCVILVIKIHAVVQISHEILKLLDAGADHRVDVIILVDKWDEVKQDINTKTDFSTSDEKQSEFGFIYGSLSLNNVRSLENVGGIQAVVLDDIQKAI